MKSKIFFLCIALAMPLFFFNSCKKTNIYQAYQDISIDMGNGGDTTKYVGYRWKLSSENMRHTADSAIIRFQVEELDGVIRSYSRFYITRDSSNIVYSANALPVNATTTICLLENKTFNFYLVAVDEKNLVDDIHRDATHLEVCTNNGGVVISDKNKSGNTKRYD